VRDPQPAGPQAALEGGAGYRFALVVSRFNQSITDALREGARGALAEAGAADQDVEDFDVPGAFELPQAARQLAQSGRFDAVVCLGCVIRGGTPHFEYISSAVTHGIMAAAVDTGLPITFGVLTTDTLAQAEERAAAGRDNKGREAAVAALEMAVLFRRLGRPSARGRAGRPFGFESTPAGRSES
jgi:6,7-dimethyl-8-ribityllumazine synthase